jgi:transcriptional regulator ATRX
VTIESDDEMHRERKPVLQKDGEGSTEEVDKVAESLALISSHPKALNLSDRSLPKTFKCTICTEMLNASDVHRPPSTGCHCLWIMRSTISCDREESS